MSKQRGPKRVEDRIALFGGSVSRAAVESPAPGPVRIRADERAELEADVDAMRRLGVAMWKRPSNEIALGPPPAIEKPIALTPEEQHRRAIEAERRQREVMFAATSVRPRIPEPASFAHVAPRGMTPTDRDDGAQKQ